MDKQTEALISSLERYYGLVFDLQESCRHILNAQEPFGFRGTPEKAAINLSGRKDIGRRALHISEDHRVPLYAAESSVLAKARVANLKQEEQLRHNGIRTGTQIGDLWRRRGELEARIKRAELDALIQMAESPSDDAKGEQDSLLVLDPAITIQALKDDIRHMLKAAGRISLITQLSGDDRRIYCNGQRSAARDIARLISIPRQATWKRECAKEEELRAAKAKGIPIYHEYFPSTASMTNDQRSFYRRWVREWKRGQSIEIGGQVSYVYCYLEQSVKTPWRNAAEELLKVCEVYGPESSALADTCRMWASDCLVVDQAYSEALDILPDPPLTSCYSKVADNRMSLKLLLHREADANDLLLLEGPRVTDWGLAHLPDIVTHMNSLILARLNDRGISLLEEWSRGTRHNEYSLFDGMGRNTRSGIKNYWFSRSSHVLNYVTTLTREAEDIARDQHLVPRIGEGWVAETTLYHEIKEALGGVVVMHHARPSWLRPQHLDIYVPSLSVAVEYQGQQHDMPVEFFGGEEAFKKTKKRDAHKKKLCKRNGVRLIYVRPGYCLDDVLCAMQLVK